MLALFFLMKVAFCCNHCGAACGPRKGIHRSNKCGTVTRELLPWPPLLERLGQVASACIMNFLTTMLMPPISCDSCEKSISTCVDRTFSFAIGCQHIARRCDNCKNAVLNGSKLNGCQRTHLNSTPLRTYGTNPSTEILPTSFLTISTNYIRTSIASWKHIVTSQTDSIHSFALHTWWNNTTLRSFH